MKLYLDLCCFNRPYDDQTQVRIRLETEAIILLQEKIKRSECHLIWSATMDFENANNPYPEHRLAIQQWRAFALAVVKSDPAIVARARMLAANGVGDYDALHVASAEAGGADLFVTTDDRLLKKLSSSLHGSVPFGVGRGVGTRPPGPQVETRFVGNKAASASRSPAPRSGATDGPGE